MYLTLPKLQESHQEITYHTDKKHHAAKRKSTGVAKVTWELAEKLWKVNMASIISLLLQCKIKIKLKNDFT